MKEILGKLFNHEKLSSSEAKQILVDISESKYNDAQVAVFMGVYMMRSVGVEELRGFRDALLELCLPIDTQGIESTDMCGTGGDGKNTFNISTTSAFVVAGAGYNVTKHGNYGVSSICGSSNVLEYLGFKFTKDTSLLLKQLDETNICFIHAPLFHPAMKAVAPIRKQLGVKTFFNMLGPLVNPAKPTHQTVGVFSIELARIYEYILESEQKEYNILHALDGYDEISLTDETLCITNNGTQVLDAKTFYVPYNTAKDIHGGDTIKASADILVSILDNEGTDAQMNVVLCNAATAIQTFERDKSLLECFNIAQESIDSGSAKKSFSQLLKMNGN
jgi:anthranilate phosphoribosyltransferase